MANFGKRKQRWKISSNALLWQFLEEWKISPEEAVDLPVMDFGIATAKTKTPGSLTPVGNI